MKKECFTKRSSIWALETLISTQILHWRAKATHRHRSVDFFCYHGFAVAATMKLIRIGAFNNGFAHFEPQQDDDLEYDLMETARLQPQ